MTYINPQIVEQHQQRRATKNKMMRALFFGATMIGLIVLAVLIGTIVYKGAGHLSWQFFTRFSSSTPALAGIKGALVGTLWLMATIIPISLILGVGTAIYLEEYAKDNAFTQFIRVNISNLAGVPSIIFGLLGLTLFVRGAGIESLSLGKTVIAAGLTLSLLILPVIIVASQEAIRAVPQSVRDASYGLGANKWQTIYRVILPAALPGVLTGRILALSLIHI